MFPLSTNDLSWLTCLVFVSTGQLSSQQSCLGHDNATSKIIFYCHFDILILRERRHYVLLLLVLIEVDLETEIHLLLSHNHYHLHKKHFNL